MESGSILRGKQVAIIGAGPGGLTLARLLQLRGVSVRVFERDASSSGHGQEPGGGLDLHESSGQHALEQAGLLRRFHELARPRSQRSRVFDKHGDELFDMRESGEPETRPEIERHELRELLLESLEPGTVLWETPVRDVAKGAGERHEIRFDHGEVFEADLVVGCDGVWSRARPVLSPVQPSYVGVTFVETRFTDPDVRSPHIAKLVGTGNIAALGDEKGLMARRNGDGSIRVYVVMRIPEMWVKQKVVNFGPARIRQKLLEQFGDWAPRVRALLEESDDVFALRPLYTFPAEHAWPTRAGITLLGDAAHVMPPFAVTARGANMAMLDAVELVDALATFDGVSSLPALRHYEERMLARMAPAIRETLAAQDQIISKSAPAALGQAIRARRTRRDLALH